jgi:hypothetical protein
VRAATKGINIAGEINKLLEPQHTHVVATLSLLASIKIAPFKN